MTFVLVALVVVGLVGLRLVVKRLGSGRSIQIQVETHAGRWAGVLKVGG
jgi:hypothetical protein